MAIKFSSSGERLAMLEALGYLFSTKQLVLLCFTVIPKPRTLSCLLITNRHRIEAPMSVKTRHQTKGLMQQSGERITCLDLRGE